MHLIYMNLALIYINTSQKIYLNMSQNKYLQYYIYNRVLNVHSFRDYWSLSECHRSYSLIMLIVIYCRRQ